jgi:hypothetical protein
VKAYSVPYDPFMNPTTSVTHERISQRAHHLWEQAGRPDGSGVDHWLHAERDLHQGEEQKNATHIHPAEPSQKHVVQTAPHSAPYVPKGVTTDSLHHQRRR